MKTTRIIILTIFLLLVGCSNLGMIIEGDLINNFDGNKTKLTKEQLIKINAIINSNPKRIFEQKWQIGNYIVAKDSKGQIAKIYSYADRYYCIDKSILCYEVSHNNLNDFKNVFLNK